MVATIRTADVAQVEINEFLAEQFAQDQAEAIVGQRFQGLTEAYEAVAKVRPFFAGTPTVLSVWVTEIPKAERTYAEAADFFGIVPSDIEGLRRMVKEATTGTSFLLDVIALNDDALPEEFDFSPARDYDDDIFEADFERGWDEFSDVTDYPEFPA